MRNRVPELDPNHPPPGPGRTGPRTAEGKIRSSRNALKHGLSARAAVLPGEDPAAYAEHMAGVTASLAPVGAAEAELARLAAATLWRLRRAGQWEAARARLAAHARSEDLQPRLDAVDREIADRTGELRALQRDPAAEPPLLVRLPDLPDAAPVDALEVYTAYDELSDPVPDQVAVPDLADLCRRIGLPPEAVQEPAEWPGWQAGHVRRLVAEFAGCLNAAPEECYREAYARWAGELPEEWARRRRRRKELRQEIDGLQQHKRDLVADRAVPDDLRADLLGRYEAAALKALDRVLKALRQLQLDRREREG